MKTDHSITKGYPYEKIISQERFKNRLKIILDRTGVRKKEDVTNIWADPILYPDYKPATWLQRKIAGKVIDFLEFRLFDYAEALLVAENQIEHLLEERPFIAEDFGFVKTVGPKDIHDNPTKIYTSKWNDNISIFENDDEEHEWHMLTRAEGFHDTKLILPNHRIAYAAFLALGIKVEAEEREVELEWVNVKDLKYFRAEYYDGVVVDMASDEKAWKGYKSWANLKAYDEIDAREKAKYIFETGDIFGLKDVDPEKITITEIQQP